MLVTDMAHGHAVKNAEQYCCLTEFKFDMYVT